MGCKLFIGFDGSVNAANLQTTLESVATWWARWIKPPGVFHNRGVATQDQTIAPIATPPSANSPFVTGRSGVNGQGSGYAYGFAATGSTYHTSQWSSQNTAKGYQLGIKRSTYGITDEVYISFDWKWYNQPSATLSSSYEPSSSWRCCFKWGDLEVRFKESTWNSGSSQNTVVLSVRNNGSEIATVTVPGVTGSTWQFVRIHAKLHATTGMIDVTVDGYGMSAAYTGQNTIATTSLATADHVYVGPITADNNSTTFYDGVIDNVYMSDTAFASGRPLGTITYQINADSSLTNWAAEGTSPTTVANALTSVSDAKAARGSGVGAVALLGLASLSTTGLDATILAFELHTFKISNRDITAAKKLSIGLSKSGVHQMGTVVAAILPPTDTSASPPATNYQISGSEFFFDPGYVISDWANIRVRLLTTA